MQRLPQKKFELIIAPCDSLLNADGRFGDRGLLPLNLLSQCWIDELLWWRGKGRHRPGDEGQPGTGKAFRLQIRSLLIGDNLGHWNADSVGGFLR
jgi:hypothetical protein